MGPSAAISGAKERYFFPLSTYVERTKLMGMTDG